MKKWYQKSIYIVTRKNFLSFFLLLSTIFFYIIEEVIGSDKSISTFLLGLTIGQQIGYRVAKIEKVK
jgi:hypothetical protein